MNKSKMKNGRTYFDVEIKSNEDGYAWNSITGHL